MKTTCTDLISGSDGLTTLTTKLNQSLEQLKKDWNTPAGDKFFQDLEDDWSDQVAQYTKIVDAVSDLLDEAIKQYTPVQEAANNLKI